MPPRCSARSREPAPARGLQGARLRGGARRAALRRWHGHAAGPAGSLLAPPEGGASRGSRLWAFL
eukprot:7246267-Pyramimonas_sp.AAC.1